LLSAAVEAAVADAPKNLTSWTWGAFQSVVIQNPVLGQVPILQHWTGPGLQQQSGGPYTVKAMGRTYGPSERITVNLANLDESTLNLVTGEAGNFLSPYYMDQWNAWYQGFTFVWPFSSDAAPNSRAHLLTLTANN
jgi:penicillin G amidase